MHINRAEVEQSVFIAVLSGEFELGLAEDQFIALLDDAVASGATKVLVDGRQMTGKPTDFERFLYGEFVASATLDVLFRHNLRLKFAYVIHEPLRDPERFGENVAVNRGMNVKAFEDKNEAIEWLNGRPSDGP